ncbi:MAG: efflux RND transporter periplasmic adaptor subunit, partial [Cyanobacteria bacterium]|nr:efflux RND transporter periplasmic adaptor subunit [Cyanobacteriota bacterium]
IENSKATAKRLQAHITFSQRELHRYDDLAQQGAVSFEMRDEKLRDLDSDRASLEAANAATAAAHAQASAYREKVTAAKAAVAAAQADVEEIEMMSSFQQVTAPCDGVITARNVDAGALVSKGSSTNNQVLLKMARTDTLRVFVYIPQSDYKGVYPGMRAKINVAELRDKVIEGKVAHISGGLDPTSRTLQTEIQIPNKAGLLLPGMFAQVTLSTQRDNPPALVPDSAIIVRPEGQYVIQVAQNNSAHYRLVKLGRDFGHESEVLDGLQAGDVVVTDPSNEIKEGDLLKTELRETPPVNTKPTNKPHSSAK